MFQTKEMARRGSALADIKTNEDLNALLEKNCVHGLYGRKTAFHILFTNSFEFTVLNVYDGFFGPCNAIATNLRDFKLLQGGDDLQVTTVCVEKLLSRMFSSSLSNQIN